MLAALILALQHNLGLVETQMFTKSMLHLVVLLPTTTEKTCGAFVCGFFRTSFLSTMSGFFLRESTTSFAAWDIDVTSIIFSWLTFQQTGTFEFACF